jgi:hypothetical protein
LDKHFDSCQTVDIRVPHCGTNFHSGRSPFLGGLGVG